VQEETRELFDLYARGAIQPYVSARYPLSEGGRAIAEVAARRAEGKAIELRATEPSFECSVLGDRLALRRIVTNLIDNALKYGGSACLSLQAVDAGVALTVDDAGPGIPLQARELVLEPFVRLEDSRSRRTGGAGLGLAVVRALVEAHRGTVRIADAPGGGGRVIVRLPLFGS